jgi:type II secretory pathway component PulF
MPRFSYRAVDAEGKVVKGREHAPSREALEKRLSGSALVPLAIEEEGGTAGRGSGGPKRVLEFTMLLSSLLESGLTVKDALEVIVAAATRKDVATLAAGLASSIETGKDFSSALEGSGAAFPRVYLGLVRIGERTGTLDKVMPGLARYLSDRAKMRDKLLGALAYPIAVLFVGVFGLGGVLAFVLPRFSELFASTGGEGAEAVKANVALAGAIGLGAMASMIALAAALVASAIARKRDKAFAIAFDSLVLKLPLIGSLLRTEQALAFSFAMETLTSGGVTIDEALLEAASVMQNAAFSRAAETMRERVRKGAPLSRACAEAGVFPPYLTQWLAVGERTGQVEKVFAQTRAFFQAESDKASSRLMTMAEPAITVIIGIGVLLMVVFFILPIFRSYGSIAQF